MYFKHFKHFIAFMQAEHFDEQKKNGLENIFSTKT